MAKKNPNQSMLCKNEAKRKGVVPVLISIVIALLWEILIGVAVIADALATILITPLIWNLIGLLLVILLNILLLRKCKSDIISLLLMSIASYYLTIMIYALIAGLV